jgi:hypothetical protein
VQKSFDSHVCEAAEYGAMQCGTDVARRRNDAIKAAKQKRREEARKAGRYNPLRRRA